MSDQPADLDLSARLTPEQLYVTQQKGTERAFTGPDWKCISCSTATMSTFAATA